MLVPLRPDPATNTSDGSFVGGALVRFGLLKLPESIIAFTSKVPYGEQILISTIGAIIVVILARVLGRS